MAQLFTFFIGGSVPGCHLELHDIRFAVGEKAENCWDQLRAQWWGTPESLHLDAWGPLIHADGHDITLSKEPPTGEDRLWFVHLGGYDPAQFTELHHNAFLVAPDARTAKARALESTKNWTSPHKDSILDVDNVVSVNDAVRSAGLHLHLSPGEATPFEFKTGYVPIGRM